MLTIGDERIENVFLGTMGIKLVCIGDEEVYKRPGGFFYIELISKEEENNG